MSVFNSLGSNYTFRFALRALFSSSRPSLTLVSDLEKRYGGKVVLCYKGRQALELALELADCRGPVAMNGYTCYAVYKAITNAGCTPVYLDIETNDLDYSAATLVDAANKQQLKAVIVQNTLGYPCDIQGILAICKQHNLVLIEDLAHSIGAHYPTGEEVGTVGDFTILSFSQDKVVDAVSGGALIIRNQTYAKAVAKGEVPSRKQQRKDRWYPMLTWLIRTTHSWGLGKALHRVARQFDWLSKPITGQLEKGIQDMPTWLHHLIAQGYSELEQQLAHRRTIAALYANKLSKKVQLAVSNRVPLAVNLRFPIRTECRDEVLAQLKEANIYLNDIWYDAPIAPAKYLAETDYAGQCPEAEKRAKTMLNLPTHRNVTEAEAEKIISIVNTCA